MTNTIVVVIGHTIIIFYFSNYGARTEIKIGAEKISSKNNNNKKHI